MSRWLVDTNVLISIDNPKSPVRSVAIAADNKLRLIGEELCVCPQVCSEYWSAVTRKTQGGVALSPQDAHSSIHQFQTSLYIWLQDPVNLFDDWLSLYPANKVTGAKCFDVRLAALMLHYNIDHILTFNYKDFIGLQGITAVEPATL
jgi:predicted nucleic acid-binding protein